MQGHELGMHRVNSATMSSISQNLGVGGGGATRVLKGGGGERRGCKG